MIDDYGNECRGEVERLREQYDLFMALVLAEYIGVEDANDTRRVDMVDRWLKAHPDGHVFDLAAPQTHRLRRSALVARAEAAEAERDALLRRWESVPWEAIFLLHNTSHMAHRAFHNLHDVTVIDYLVAWAKKHAPKEAE